MHSRNFLGLLVWLAMGAGPLLAQGVHTPATGSAERKAIMDVLREPCEKDLGRSVIFRVQHLRVAGDWAFARVVPIQPDGKEIDYARTKYAEQSAEGMFDAKARRCFAGVAPAGSCWSGASARPIPKWIFGWNDTGSRRRF